MPGTQYSYSVCQVVVDLCSNCSSNDLCTWEGVQAALELEAQGSLSTPLRLEHLLMSHFTGGERIPFSAVIVCCDNCVPK